MDKNDYWYSRNRVKKRKTNQQIKCIWCGRELNGNTHIVCEIYNDGGKK